MLNRRYASAGRLDQKIDLLSACVRHISLRFCENGVSICCVGCSDFLLHHDGPDQNGFLAEVVDVQEWARAYADIPVPVPSGALSNSQPGHIVWRACLHDPDSEWGDEDHR